MSRPARAWLDPEALRHNLAKVRERAPRSRVMAIIKANAYGHGLTWAARTLGGVDAFGVASIEEGCELRAAGIIHPVCLLEGFFEASEIPLLTREGLIPTIHEPGQVEAITATRAPLEVWLKLDSGMHRLGFPLKHSDAVFKRLLETPGVSKIGVMSHLASADNPFDNATHVQIEAFLAATASWGIERSVANSAGILGWPKSHLEWVRPGLMLYGMSPLIGRQAIEFDLRPVMTLESAVIAVREHCKGAAIGYGGDYICPENMPVGVVAIGYGDGYPRHASSGTPVLVGDTIVPLIGRVSMDMITVDLRRRARTRVGDRVVLWGRGLPAEEVARHAQTIPYTLVCGVTPRIPRKEIRDGH
ncbi:MAG: alanine racemase [Acidiferrobacteraceae bacterium]